MAGYIFQDRCAKESELVVIETPWDYDSGPWGGLPIRVRLNRALKARFKFACKLAAEYSRFGGGTGNEKVERIDSYVCRDIRGQAGTISWHGKGAAFDIFATNPQTPPPGGVWTPDKTYGEDFALCFTGVGFTWGHYWDRQDDPHLEWRPAEVPVLTLKERRRLRRAAKERFLE